MAKIKEQRQNFFIAYELLDDAVVITGGDGEIEYYNSAAEIFFGIQPEHSADLKLEQLLECEETENSWKKILDKIQRSGEWRGRLWY